MNIQVNYVYGTSTLVATAMQTDPPLNVSMTMKVETPPASHDAGVALAKAAFQAAADACAPTSTGAGTTAGASSTTAQPGATSS